MDTEKLIEAFHLMWSNFPEPVRLIFKDRTVIAFNQAGEKVGYLIGSKCSSSLPLEAHQICQANEAMRSRVCTYAKLAGTLGGEALTFWTPIDGYDDYYVHFAVGRRFSY